MLKYLPLLLLLSCGSGPDPEVSQLQERLKPHGITVFRVDPDNPEHQRRYARHLRSFK